MGHWYGTRDAIMLGWNGVAQRRGMARRPKANTEPVEEGGTVRCGVRSSGAGAALCSRAASAGRYSNLDVVVSCDTSASAFICTSQWT